MAVQTFTIDPAAAVALTGDEIVTKINTDTTTDITKAGVVDPSARPIEAGEVGTTELADDAVTGNRPSAIGVLTLVSNVADTTTVTIDGKTYTAQITLTDVDGNILRGATASDTIDNLVAAIGLGAGAGTLYATSTTEHATVLAQTGAGDTMDVVAKTGGTSGNAITTTVTGLDWSWSGATLIGGSNAKLVSSAARDSLTSMKDIDRKFVLTRPITASGDFKVLSMKRRSDGLLEVEFDSVAV